MSDSVLGGVKSGLRKEYRVCAGLVEAEGVEDYY
jgi:hypothetical protein